MSSSLRAEVAEFLLNHYDFLKQDLNEMCVHYTYIFQVVKSHFVFIYFSLNNSIFLYHGIEEYSRYYFV